MDNLVTFYEQYYYSFTMKTKYLAYIITKKKKK